MSRMSWIMLMIAALALIAAGCGGDAADDISEDGTTVAAEDAGDRDGGEGAEEEGGEEAEAADVDLAAGKQLFIDTCGSCHTLDDAGTSGTVGPDLGGSERSADDVATVIAEGRGVMPAGLLEGDDADAVAAYVADATK